MNAFVARVGSWWSEAYPTKEQAVNAALEYGRQQDLPSVWYTIFRTGWCPI